MMKRTNALGLVSGLALAAIAAPAAAGPVYAQTDLVTDSQEAVIAAGFAPALTVDPALVNPWGLSISPRGPWWISNQGTNTSTLYTGAGAKIPLTVSIPQAPNGPQGPTGQVFNNTASFVLPTGGKAAFIFASLDGSISAWNGAQGTKAVVFPSAPGRIYTGLAINSTGGQDYLYATNAATGKIDVYDGNFALTTVKGGFVDPTLPAGLTPFNVQSVGGHVFVTYAIPGSAQDDAALGQGAVSEFGADGTFVRRVATGGNLTSPWGIARAPFNFGKFSHDLLVANFSSQGFGFIDAYDFKTGAFEGQLLNADLSPINIPYLWGIAFGNGGLGGPTNQLFFNAGIGDEQHGLFGSLAAVPAPPMFAMFGLSALALVAVRRRGR